MLGRSRLFLTFHYAKLGKSLNCYFERVGRGWEGGPNVKLAVDGLAVCRRCRCLDADGSIGGRTQDKGNVELGGRRGTRGRIDLHVID